MSDKDDEREYEVSSKIHHGQTGKSSKQVKTFDKRAPFWKSVKLSVKRKIQHEVAKRDPRHR